jgi:hypothetical protein
MSNENDVTNRDLSARVTILYERITQPYDPRNRSELPLEEDQIRQLLNQLVDISNEFSADQDNRTRVGERARNGVLRLFDLGEAIVNACLISTIAQGSKLLYPPPIADICLAWIELFVKAFDRATMVRVELPIEDTDPVQTEELLVPVEQVQDTDTLVADQPPGVFVLFTFDNAQETLDNTFVRINLALEQLEELKQLLDPDNQRVVQLLQQAQLYEEQYARALTEYTTNPTLTATQNLARAASALAKHSQRLEAQYAKQADARLLGPLGASRTLLATYLPLIQVRGQDCIATGT